MVRTTCMEGNLLALDGIRYVHGEARRIGAAWDSCTAQYQIPCDDSPSYNIELKIGLMNLQSKPVSLNLGFPVSTISRYEVVGCDLETLREENSRPLAFRVGRFAPAVYGNKHT